MKFAKREKLFVSIAACFIAIFLLFQFLIFPFFEKRERMQRGIEAREKDLKDMAALSAEFKARKKDSQEIQKILAGRKQGFTLFSFLERSAGEAQVKEHIKYMKPSTSKGTGPYKESTVELKLETLTLNQLIGYLYRIEKPKDLIIIKRISIKENKKESGYLDAILQVLTFQ
ncbi:MAG: type II secretion system protein M [Deltaproteobacteria bacterium]|nr:type II secretion system protein M [Deltaproteobacteria bacterium]